LLVLLVGLAGGQPSGKSVNEVLTAWLELKPQLQTTANAATPGLAEQALVLKNKLQGYAAEFRRAGKQAQQQQLLKYVDDVMATVAAAVAPPPPPPLPPPPVQSRGTRHKPPDTATSAAPELRATSNSGRHKSPRDIPVSDIPGRYSGHYEHRNRRVWYVYDAFGVFGNTFWELGCKNPMFYDRAVPKTPSAPHPRTVAKFLEPCARSA
jgi:hypothetical protein